MHNKNQIDKLQNQNDQIVAASVMERQIRKEKIVEFINSDLYVPMKEKELASFMQVSKEDRPLFRELLGELMRESKICVTQKGKYQKMTSSLLIGSFISNSKGFGFVVIEGQDEDYYIAKENVMNAFHGDLVEIVPVNGNGGKRKEARVVKIIEHTMTKLVGTFQSHNTFGFVIPDNGKLSQDIFIAKEHCKGAVNGHKVVVELTSYGSDRDKPEGKIVEILGHINDPGVDILSVVRGYDLPVEFTEKQLQQATRVAKPVDEADRAGRKDLRHTLMITIDGEDAKDLDDAVSLTVSEGKYYLGVHIADVTNYVQENSALDHEALRRGNSVYLADRVIPMLPHALCNGICSLNAGEDRLALSCLMTIAKDGSMLDYDICESVIHVDYRMSYTMVQKLLEDDTLTDREEECRKYKEILPMLKDMATLSTILRDKRHERGAIDFDFPEAKFLMNEDGSVKDILLHDRNTATKMIEDFMLAANETVAQHFYWLDTPFVYRIHENPDEDRMKTLSAFLQNYGITLKSTQGETGKVHPKELQKMLEKIEGSTYENLIERMTLRSMKQAKYSVSCNGHYGLACKYYCHFTSPIRRYPDLQIHRIIKDQLRGRMNDEKKNHYGNILASVAQHTSQTERVANNAERDTDKIKKAQYMEQFVGDEFDGIISGVNAYGIYVELPNTVEGFIHISKLTGDYYVYREETFELIGEMTGKKYSLGMPLHVFLEATNRLEGTIEFSLY